MVGLILNFWLLGALECQIHERGTFQFISEYYYPFMIYLDISCVHVTYSLVAFAIIIGHHEEQDK